MLSSLRRARIEYPRQFWLLFWGMLISTTGASMVWPFLMLYVSKRVDLPLTAVAGLMTLNSGFGLVFSFIAGPITDRFGRKWVMFTGLLFNGLAYLMMSSAGTYAAFAVMMSISGAFNPLYRVGANAMLADLVPSEKRADAFSLLRLSNNVGVAAGPALGGLAAVTSYSLAFFGAAAGLITFSILVLLFAVETLPAAARQDKTSLKIGKSSPTFGSRRFSRLLPSLKRAIFSAYIPVFRDRHFLHVIGSLTLTIICAGMMWVLLPVYTNTHFNIPESQYGLIPTTNALMVVFLQIGITNFSKRRPPLYMMALGSLFFALGVGSVSLGQGFWGFWLSMVIMTFGELILIPTNDTYIANLAPLEMRGRYMSLAGLTWGIATGIGPVIGGFLSDQIAPVTIWYGALVIGLCGALGFLVLARSRRRASRMSEVRETEARIQ
ncbi:MAG: MFS transporter [Chloroflexi bacterium]|nr:MAG: MFS transporter [Chloroflexota bacterium]